MVLLRSVGPDDPYIPPLQPTSIELVRRPGTNIHHPSAHALAVLGNSVVKTYSINRLPAPHTSREAIPLHDTSSHAGLEKFFDDLPELLCHDVHGIQGCPFAAGLAKLCPQSIVGQ